MSEITRAVLGMPYEIAMVDEISRRQFFDRAHTEIATLQARLSELEAVTLERADEGLSKWQGWDQSREFWSESKHKDSVLEALFRAPWSMEDAATLIGFIDRTWGRALQESGK